MVTMILGFEPITANWGYKSVMQWGIPLRVFMDKQQLELLTQTSERATPKWEGQHHDTGYYVEELPGSRLFTMGAVVRVYQYNPDAPPLPDLSSDYYQASMAFSLISHQASHTIPSPWLNGLARWLILQHDPELLERGQGALAQRLHDLFKELGEKMAWGWMRKAEGELFRIDRVMLDEIEKTGANGSLLGQTLRQKLGGERERGRGWEAWLKQEEWTPELMTEAGVVYDTKLMKKCKKNTREALSLPCVIQVGSNEAYPKDYYGHPLRSPLCEALAQALWLDQVKPSLVAPRGELKVMTSEGQGYAKVEKNIGAISWSFGTLGDIQDGHAAAPQGIVRLMNRARGFAPKDGRPAQSQLGLGFIDSSEPCDSLQTMLNDTNALMGGGVAKALLFLTAAGCADRRQIPLDELTARLNPGLSRIQKRDHEATLADVRALRGLALILPDNTDIQILDIQVGREYESKEQPVVWRYMGSFHDLIRGNLPGAESALHGQLILNMDLAMSLTKHQALELRALVYASAVFNDSKIKGEYSEDVAPWRTIEEIATTLNALSPAALDSMRGSGSGRPAKSKDSAKVLEALDLLHERGGVRLEQQGKGRNTRYKLAAPDAWRDAYQQWRNRYK